MQEFSRHWSRWQARCADVLYGNLLPWDAQKQLTYRYTAPAREKGKYLPQWLWDSCFHALAYRWFDPDMAWEELLALTVHQVPEGHPDAGMIPHMGHLGVAGDLSAQRLFRHPQRSSITQPPLMAVAARRVYALHEKREHLETIYQANKRYHAWFERRRVDSDGLVALIHPWEAGWDASQRWDEALDVSQALREGSHFAEVMTQLKAIRWRLMQQVAHYGGDALALRDAGHFYVKPVDFNAIRVADLREMAQIAELLGYGDEAAHFRQQAEQSATAIREKLLHRVENDALHISDLVWHHHHERHSGIDTAAKFVLLFGQCVDDATAQQLRDELVAGPYATPYSVPTTPTDNLTFDGLEYWRGNVWMPVNWLIYTGLRAYGFETTARDLAENSLALVDKSGFCEFFDPITGVGGQALGVPAPQRQSWTSIVLDMLATETKRDR